MSVTTSSARVRASTAMLTNQAIAILVSILIFLPSALFAACLKPVPAIVVIAGCFSAIAILVKREACGQGCLGEPIRLPDLLLAIGLAFVILILGGETHLFYATSDWQIRDAVLADLVAHGFPTTYHVGDSDYLLRAPLGMYMAPALVGHRLGLFAAHLALLVQNALILGSIFYFITVIGRGWAHLAIVVLFAGLSIVGAGLVLAAKPPHGVPFWLRNGLDSWHPLFQYSASIVQFFWVPNHALPGWWLAVLLLMQRPSSPDVAKVGVSVAGLAFWSPLAVIPVVPWLLFTLVRAWRPVLLSPRTWWGAAASACFLPILAYMLIASTSIAHETTIERADFAFWYLIFILLQLPTLFFLAFVWRQVPQNFRALVVINGLVLVALPFYHFGPNNDLVMRGSITSLVIVAFVFGWVLIDLTKRRAPAALVGWALVVLAAPSAMVEIGRALATPRYAISDCTLMEASEATGSIGAPANYAAPVGQVPKWLLETQDVSSLSVLKQACWPDRVAPRYFGITYKTAFRP